MAITNQKGFTGKIFVPGSTNVVSKIIITDSSGTDYTVLNSYSGSSTENYTISASVTRPVTTKIGNFVLQLSNDKGRYYNKFSGGETVTFYADLTDATDVIFVGKIDNISYGLDSSNGFYIEIDGRDYPEMTDKTITGIESSVKADISLAGILYNDFTDITLVFWTGSEWAEATYDSDTDFVTWSVSVSTFPSTLLNYSYQDKKAWTVISEICKRVGLDCYLEYDNDNSRWLLRTFVIDSIQNNNVYVSYGMNLLSMREYGRDNNKIYNRIKVYGGQESDNILLIKTEEDTDSINTLWTKDLIINDPTITSMTEVQEKADSELSINTSTENTGFFTAIGMNQVRPGDNVYCVVPYTPINGYHKISSFTHYFDGMFRTSVDIEERALTAVDLFISRDNPDDIVSNVTNINGMKDSYTVYFNESPSVITHSGTEEASGVIRLSSGQTTGQATSDFITTDYQVTQCEFRRYENFATENDSYEVTNNGGVNWETYSTASGDIHTFETIGSQLGFRMNLSRASSTATSPAYESVSLLYKN